MVNTSGIILDKQNKVCLVFQRTWIIGLPQALLRCVCYKETNARAEFQEETIEVTGGPCTSMHKKQVKAGKDRHGLYTVH